MAASADAARTPRAAAQGSADSGPAAPKAAAGYELSITRVFDAPRALVFEAWIRPEHLGHWSAPEGFTFPFHESDVRPGGAYRCCMRAPDGTDHWLHGTYQEIVPPERLVFTHVWEDPEGRSVEPTLVTVEFSDEGGRTRMEFHQAFFTTATSRDGHAQGWQSCFGLLDAYLARRLADTRQSAETMEESFYVPLPDPRIVTRSFLVGGLRREHPRSEAAFATMEEQWADFAPLIDRIPNRADRSTVSVFFRMYGTFDSFAMVTGVDVQARGRLAAGLAYEEIAPYRYAVFAHDGHVSTLRNTVWTIWERWLPRSGHAPASGNGTAPDFIEVYGADFDPKSGLGTIEVWVPLA